nr:site-specific DNA-methyltransferase [Rhodomicrobium udaipurense]
MACLAEREGLRGKVQCIYFDPPYGIRFNSNFQWSTTSRDVKDGAKDHITREPEQVRAFRDTWRDGIHSYLTYLRDRLTVAHDLLTDSGSIFVQIGDENVHRVRALMDEVFGEENFCSLIQVQKTGSQAANLLAATVDFVVWYARSKSNVKYRQLYNVRVAGHVSSDRYDQIELLNGEDRRLTRDELNRTANIPCGRIFRHTSLISSGQASQEQILAFHGRKFTPGSGSHWKTTINGMNVLGRVGRINAGKSTVRYKRYFDDFAVLPITDRWESLQIGTGLVYVVQTSTSVIERCILMATDPGDLVLDPTCGSGTTAYVAEQWGRRWITIDTSRVAIALARSRLMGARYPYYLLADSPEGQLKEAEVSRTAPKTTSTRGNIRFGFVYDRVPHITLKSIADNTEIDVIWDRMQPAVEDARAALELRAEGPQAAVQGGNRRSRWREDRLHGEGRCDATFRRGRSRERVHGMGNPPRGTCWLASGGAGRARPLLGGAHRPSKGNRRLHRRESRVRVSLRQALRRQQPRARGRSIHGGKPLSASYPRGGLGRRAVRHPRSVAGPARASRARRSGDRFRAHDP